MTRRLSDHATVSLPEYNADMAQAFVGIYQNYIMEHNASLQTVYHTLAEKDKNSSY